VTDFSTFMAGGGWILFSLIAALPAAISLLANQYFRLPGHLLVFWSRVMTVLCMALFMPSISLPEDPRFYIAVGVTALLGAFADMRSYNASARHGGGAVSRVMPLGIVLSFFVWIFVDTGLVAKYLDHAFNTGVILAALAGITYFSTRLRHCVVTRAAFIDMLPALLGYTVTNVLNKYAMHFGVLEGAVFGYMFVQSVIAVVLAGGYAAYHESKPHRAHWSWPPLVWGAAVVTFAWITHMTFKNYAMAFTPNPAYQSALLQITPLLVALAYKITGHKENADVKSGFGLVAFVALLALATIH